MKSKLEKKNNHKNNNNKIKFHITITSNTSVLNHKISMENLFSPKKIWRTLIYANTYVLLKLTKKDFNSKTSFKIANSI